MTKHNMNCVQCFIVSQVYLCNSYKVYCCSYWQLLKIPFAAHYFKESNYQHPVIINNTDT